MNLKFSVHVEKLPKYSSKALVMLASFPGPSHGNEVKYVTIPVNVIFPIGWKVVVDH